MVGSALAQAVVVGVMAGRGYPPWVMATVVALTGGFGLFVTMRSVRRHMQDLTKKLRARDFEAILNVYQPPGAMFLREIYDLGVELREREQAVRGREALLRRVVDNVPMAMVLFRGDGDILTANAAARDLFFDGRAAEGENFLRLLHTAPEALRRAIAGSGELVTLPDDRGNEQSLHLAKRVLTLDGEAVVMVLVTNVTRELGRQEVAAWKRVIRVLSHEVNNSLAPLTSLAHSGKILVQGRDEEARLTKIFDTVERRATHLVAFLDGYAKVARLPEPRQEPIDWDAFVSRVLALFPGARRVGDLPTERGFADPAQLEQVVVNLVKNAVESGSAMNDVTLAIEHLGQEGTRIVVSDRGGGMSREALESARVPFFSTKQGGSGLGLALSREIIEAHGGTLHVATRPLVKLRDGRGATGVEVTVHLPARDRSLAPPTLSLSRAGSAP